MSSDLFVPEYIYSGRVGLLLPTPLAAVIVYIYVHRCCTVEFNNSLHISTHSLERSIKKLLNVPQEKRNHIILNTSTRIVYLSPECSAFGEL